MTQFQADRITLSLLWAFVAINIAYADILSLHVPGTLEEVIQGVVDGVALSATLMLIGAVFLQIPLVMMVASQVLPPRALTQLSLAAALITSVFIVAGGSTKPHYLFIAATELAALLCICWIAWNARARAWNAKKLTFAE